MVNGKGEAGPNLATSLNPATSGSAARTRATNEAGCGDAVRVCERAVWRAELLGETAAKLLGCDHPQDIVEELCAKVMEYLDCQVFFNFLVVPTSASGADISCQKADRLRLNACAGIPAEEAAKIEWLDYGVAVCGCAARDCKRIVAENIFTTPDPRTELVRSYGVRAYACHPLLERGNVIGTLSFGTRNRDRFSADDLAVMKSVTDLVAMAMTRMRDALNLRESEARYRRLSDEMAERTADLQAVLDVAPVAVWISHDVQCRRITGNRYADELVMRVPRGGNISASARVDDAAVAYKVLRGGRELKPEELPAQLAASTGKPVEPESLELVFADGRVAHMFMGAVPLLDPGGRVRGAVAAGADVTPLTMTEDALRRSEERLRLVLQASMIGTFEVDLVTGEGLWNKAEFDLLGLKPGDVVPSPEAFFRFVHPGDVGRLQSQWQEALRTGTLDTEFRIVRPDGRERWLAGRGRFASEGSAVHDRRGRATRFMGVNFDITARKHAEEALRQLNAQLEQRVAEQTSEIRRKNAYNRSLIEANLDPLVMIGSDGRITDVNAASEQATGFGRKELIGTDFTTYFTEPAKARAGYLQAFKDGLARDHPLELRTRDGRTIPVLYNAAVYRDETGTVTGVIAAARDISERIHAQTALQELNATLERRVSERTAELRSTNEELERFNRAAVDRELRMIQLKRQVNELSERLGEPRPYPAELVTDEN